MEMLNRAVEDAADSKYMMRRIEDGTSKHRDLVFEALYPAVKQKPPKLQCENRQQYRARIRNHEDKLND